MLRGFTHYLAVLTISLLSLGTAHGDKVILKGGSILQGQITDEGESQITVILDGGSGEMTLPRSVIERIEYQSPTETPVPESIPTPTATSRPLIIIGPTATPSPVIEVKSATAAAVITLATHERREFSAEDVQKLGGGRRMVGTARDVVGTIEVKRPGTDWQTEGETLLFEGDQIRTQTGRTKVFMEEADHKTEIRLREESTIQFPTGETSIIDLQKGKVWSRLQSLSSSDEVKLRIRTPNAVAGIRGTLLYVQLAEQDSRVAVFEGAVQVSGRTQTEQMQQVTEYKAITVSAQEQLSALRDVDRNEIKEWDEWDKWAEETKAQLAPYVRGKPGGQVVEAMVDQIAAEGKLYSQMVDEYKGQVQVNRQAEQLEAVKKAILQYVRDIGQLPPQDFGLTYLQNNLVASPNWRGPYLPQGYMLPLRDAWGSEIRYEIRTSPTSGRVYAVVISCGPDRIYSRGDSKTDDIMVLVNPQ